MTIIAIHLLRRVNKCLQYVFTSACLLAMLQIGSAAQAAVGDYGVMWSNQLVDGENNDGTYNRYNLHGGALSNSGYVNNAWIHSNSSDPAKFMWGKQSTAGGWQGAVTQFDHYGNNVWTDFHSPINQQSYMRGSYTRGDTTVVTGWSRQNIETLVAEDTAYVVAYDGSGDLTDPGRIYGNSYRQTNGGAWGRAAWIAPNGDVWTTGYAQGDLGGQTYTGAGDRDMYIFSHAADGSVTSGTFKALSTGIEIPGGILVDEGGSVYVAGGTNGSIAGFTNAGAAGTYDIYIVKYDSNFNQQWIQQIGGPGSEFVYSMEFDASGNIMIAGDMTADIDGTTNAGEGDAYIRVFDTDGNLVWNDQFGTAGDDWASGLSFDENGNIWTGGKMGGNFAAPLDGGDDDISDIFFRQFDTNGTVMKDIQLGTDGEDWGTGAAVDGNPHRLYIGGGVVNGAWRGWNGRLNQNIENPQNEIFHAEAMTLKVTAGDFYDSDAMAAGQDGYVDWDDLTQVMTALDGGDLNGDTTYDFDGDGDSTSKDIAYFMEELFESQFGDFNWDGKVDEADRTLLEDNLGSNVKPEGWRGLFDGNIGQNEQDALDANFGYPDATPTLPADLTGNGFVDFEDLTILLANWNQHVGEDDGNLVNAAATVVNFEDLTVLLAAWTGPGQGGSPEAALASEAVPEPSTAVLAVLGLLGVVFAFRRRRRA